MSDLLTFQPGVSLADGRYLLRSAARPGRWSVTIQAIRARDLTAVIIKTPIAAQGKSRFQSAWMHRTFQVLGDLNHPSRSRILDWFEQDGRPFLVFQKVKGQSLAERLQQGPLSEAIALQMIRQVAAGIAGIHSQGLLHRDIQPKNILFRQGVGLPTLVDWGLQPAQVSGDRLSPFGAPEQLQGGDIFKPCLDVYALAATLYAALTGQCPAHPTKRQYWIPNPSPADLAGLVPPRQLCPNLSPETEQAILQGLALNPQWRPGTLESWLHLFPLSQATSSQTTSSQTTDSQPAKSHSLSSGSARQGHLHTQPPPSQISCSASPNAAIPPGQLGAAEQSSATPLSHSLAPHHLAFKAPTDPALTNRASSLPAPVASQPQPRSPVRTPTTPPRIPRSQAARPQTSPPRTPPAKASIASATHLANELRAAPVQTLPPRPTATQRVDSQTMTSTAPRPQVTPSGSPINHFRRLISITVLMISMGLAGGLLLRVFNPGSVAGFSGLGRVQDFPETDWPGEAELDNVPEGVPQPEYDGDRWDDSEGELPEVVLDEEVYQDEVLAIPSERLEELERGPQRSTTPAGATWDQPDREAEGEGAYDTAEQDGYGNGDNSSDYSDYSSGGYDGRDDEAYEDYSEAEGSGGGSFENGLDSYDQGGAAVAEPSGDWNDDWNDNGWNNGDSEVQDGQESGGEESWSEDPWVDEAPQDWAETPGITADDFPEPELPPAYEAPAPQGSLLPGEEDGPGPGDGPGVGGNALYEDV